MDRFTALITGHTGDTGHSGSEGCVAHDQDDLGHGGVTSNLESPLGFSVRTLKKKKVRIRSSWIRLDMRYYLTRYFSEGLPPQLLGPLQERGHDPQQGW